MAIAYAFVRVGSLTAINIWIAILCFFVGGGTYKIYEILKNRAVWANRKPFLAIAAMGVFLTSLSLVENIDLLGDRAILYFVVFSSMILLLATLQDFNNSFGRRYRVIGDITYSSYLLHFPI